MHSEPNLKGKVALVTGGGSGIGAAIAENLCALGTMVVIAGRRLEALRQTAQRISRNESKCKPLACDVCNWESVEALARQVKDEFAALDILVNSAGIAGAPPVRSGAASRAGGTPARAASGDGGPLHEMSLGDWEQILNTNLRGVFYSIRAFAPLLIASGQGHIVNISSLAGKNPLPNGAAYAASKWGLNGLSYSVAEELRQHNVRVSVVCPGSVGTEFSPHEGKDMRKMLQASDVAHAVSMLVMQAPQSFISEVSIRPTQKP